MNKKAVAILLAILILATGCVGKTIPQDDAKETDTSVINEHKVVWRDEAIYLNAAVDFIPTSYEKRVPPYNVAADLSNIENIDRFSGFSKDQVSMLSSNGFLVMEPNPEVAFMHMKMHEIYENNEYKKIPSFVTVDVALHIYHKFFDETLKRVEKEKLYGALQQLTNNMLEKSLYLYNQDSNAEIKEELKEISVYFSVGNKLLNDSYGAVPEELIGIAEAEVENIEKAEGYQNSPLFKFDVNYEQFVVRGHYTNDEILEKYFKAMMWYGLVGNPFQDDSGDWDFKSIRRSLLITYLTYMEINGIDDVALWDKIYTPTNFFVGNSDDINILQMKEVILKVYGEDVIPADFTKEESHNRLVEELKKLPEPQIQHRLITGAVNSPTGKQFRFMGQRYTLDANIMQELMFPIIRPVPTGLDVVGALGNPRGEELANKYYLHNLRTEEYTGELNKLKEKVSNLKEEDWRQNLYNGWLWVLKEVWKPTESLEGLPFFMSNQAWQDKKIQTGLGSYSELKHDTVLYAKQPVAEMGGGEEPKVIYTNYVEPAVEVYERLLWLLQFSKVNLEKRELLNENSIVAIAAIENLYKQLISVSIKQLENQPITEEEDNYLRFIGGTIEYITATMSEDFEKDVSSAIISDVAVIADTGQVLELGTGLPNEIFVVVYSQDKIYLTRGVVYSYYEFLSDKPMTVEEWHKQIGIEKIQEKDWSYHRISPELMMNNNIPQPQWTKSFKSFEGNNVEISNVEYQVGN